MPVLPGANNAFLSELSPADFAGLRSHLIPLDLRVGAILHCLGDHVDDVILPHSGLVAMTLPLADGASAGVVLVGQEGIVGGIAAAGATPATCNAEVFIGGQASRLSAAAFRQLLDHSVSLRRRAARFDAAILAQAQQNALCNAAHPVEARICRWLLEVSDRNGGNRVPLTQNTLAQMLGVRRTTVTLIAGRLEAASVLRCHRGYMEIMSRDAMAQHTCGCYARLKGYTDRLFVADGYAVAEAASDSPQAVTV